MGANDTMATMDYEYDTGRLFSPKDNETTVKVESITDNPDGSANIVFVMSAETRDAFTRIGIMKVVGLMRRLSVSDVIVGRIVDIFQ